MRAPACSKQKQVTFKKYYCLQTGCSQILISWKIACTKIWEFENLGVLKLWKWNMLCLEDKYPCWGCWGFPHLEIKRFEASRFLVFGFFVSRFRKSSMFSKIFVAYYQMPISCFSIDFDPISKIFEILLNGSSSSPGAILFEN